MIVERVKLLNYRNLAKVDLDVSPRINIFLGRNGQGKTNLIEALCYLSLGRSHRGNRDREIIRFGTDHLHLRVEGNDSHGSFLLEAAVTSQGRKRIKRDGDPIARVSDLVGQLSTVMFHPDEIALAKGSPDRRRRFLDYTLSLTSAEYFRHLLAYRRAVAQKNRLLKTRHGFDEVELDAWDAELVTEGAPLIRARQEILSALEGASQEAYSALAPEGGMLRIGLRSSLDGEETSTGEASSVEDWRRRFEASLGRARGKERSLGFAVVGPHRDTLELELKGHPLRGYGSQGEMRSAAIALKLGQAEMIYERTRERPVVFLDDIFSELDRGRTEALQRRLHRAHQLFIATARSDDVLGMKDWEGVRVWRVHGGEVVPFERPQDMEQFRGDESAG